MKHPLVVLVAAVLSGILIGVNETPPPWRAACLFMTAFAVLKAYRKCRDLKNRTLLFCALFVVAGFLAGFFRASYVSKKYQKPETAEFFRKFVATNPGEFDYALYLKSLSVSDEEARKRLKEGEPDPDDILSVTLQGLNEKAGNVIDTCLSVHDAGIMHAMLLGDKTQMDEDVKDLYQSSGIAHLLAVSGLHVSLIGMSLYRILRKKLKAGLFPSVIAAAITTFMYALFTGGSGSSLRAAMMLITSLAAIWLGRTYDIISSLSLAAALLLLWRPYLILQSGFQLSFGAILGICAGSLVKEAGVFEECGKKGSVIEKLPGTLLSGFMVTVVTLPVIAGNFFYVPLYSVFLNVIVVPLMTVVMVSGILALSAGILIPQGRLAGTVAVIFSAPGHYILKLYEKLCTFSSGLPHSSILLGRAEPWQVIVYYALLFLLILWLRKMHFSDTKRTVAKIAGVALMLLLPITIKHYEPGSFYVCAVDVGQGDCFHIHHKGTDILIDGGCSGYDKVGENTIEPYLLSKGISTLELVIISHADADHVNGIQYLLSDDSGVKVEKLLLPAMGREDEKYKPFVESGVPVFYAKRGQKFTLSGTNYSCLYSETGSAAVNDTNRQSTVILLDHEGFRMLFTGDITKEDEAEICRIYEGSSELRGIDVLKAAHHGSKTATSMDFVKTVSPRYAVLSYGEGNRFGHPHEETLETLTECGVKMLETAKMGAVTINLDKSGYEISGFIRKGG